MEQREHRTWHGAGLVLFYGSLILIAAWLGCSRDGATPGSPAELTTATSYEDNTPAFTWTAAEDRGSGVAHYLARVDGGTWIKLGNVTACDWEAPLSDGSHGFQVRAVDKQGNEGLFASLIFVVDTTSPPKTWPISPGSWDCTDNTTPSFEWGAVSDASGVTYRLQVDNDTDFSSPCASVLGIDRPEYNLTEYLSLTDGVYYWRVCAVDGAGHEGEWSNDLSFIVDTTRPSSPELLAPWNRSYIGNSLPGMAWMSVSDSTQVYYELQVDNDSDFSSPIVGRIGLVDNYCLRAPEEAVADGAYYWRVRASDQAGNVGDWAESWLFNVDTDAPEMPVLLSPADGSHITDNTPLLDWTSVADESPVHYVCQVDDAADFSSPEANTAWANESWYAPQSEESLSSGTYYWRAKAVDAANNEGNWTGTWWFTVTAP